jgi:glycosyltransferase involved in cell wall biosynthesis
MTASPQPVPKVCVVQDGARLHYAVPIALQRQGALARMYTDWYAGRTAERAIAAVLGPVGGSRLRRMRERFARQLDVRFVRSKPSLALLQLRKGRYPSETDFFADLRRRTGRWIVDEGFGNASGVFGFVRNIDPAVCEAARARGLRVVVDQMIAPAAIEHHEAALQAERFAGWSSEPPESHGELVDLEQRTWQLADRITCASDYVRQGLISCGVDAAKIAVLPYPFDSGHLASVDRRGRSGPITVGFVGKVGLRKGAPYLFQLAARFDPGRVRFVCVGPVYLDRDLARLQHAHDIELVGPVPRSDIAGWLQRFDAFILPSTCEGSAGAVVEAMAAGLPVVVSPNAGAPITDGVEGFVTPYDDIDAMQRHIETLAADAEKRHAMGLAARQRAGQFTVDAYGRQLVALFAEGR